MKRFQECNWLVKLWRYRWYLLVPVKYVWFTFVVKFKVYRDEFDNDKLVHTDNYDVMTGKNLWSLLIGYAQYKMRWYYTLDEVKNKIQYLDE